ncbi:MAG TPA: trigger factor [Sulfurovum sp.]|nr:trigger factor [Sulfurovum sp.]
MQVTVRKLDDINIILQGNVENAVIDEKITELREEAENTLREDTSLDAEALQDKLNQIEDASFQQEAEGFILQAFIDEGMRQANVTLHDLLGQPNFKTYEKQEDGIDLEIEISTQPTIDTSVAYMDIVPSYTPVSIDPKDIDAKLEEMAIKKAPYTTISTPRAIQNGDLVNLDFEGFVEGKALNGASETEYKLKIGSNTFIPGFEEAVIGMNTGEEKSIKITFPEDFQTKELAGKEATFKVKIHEIREQIPMELNDTLARKIFDNEKATLALLKLKMKEKMEAQAFSNIYNEELKPQIIKGLLSKFDFTLPNNVVEQEIDAKINEKAQRMSKEEHERYKKDKAQFNALRDTVRKEAEDSIKAALIVDALAKKEGIEVNDEEVLSALSMQAIMTGQDAEELVEYYKANNLMTSAKVGLIEDKLFKHMLGVA